MMTHNTKLRSPTVSIRYSYALPKENDSNVFIFVKMFMDLMIFKENVMPFLKYTEGKQIMNKH